MACAPVASSGCGLEGAASAGWVHGWKAMCSGGTGRWQQCRPVPPSAARCPPCPLCAPRPPAPPGAAPAPCDVCGNGAPSVPLVLHEEVGHQLHNVMGCTAAPLLGHKLTPLLLGVYMVAAVPRAVAIACGVESLPSPRKQAARNSGAELRV